MARISNVRVTMRADEVMILTDEDHYRPNDTAMALDKAAAEKLIGELSAWVDWISGQEAARMAAMRAAIEKL